jgi:hypothetical protein
MTSKLSVVLRLPRGWVERPRADRGAPSFYQRAIGADPGELLVSLAEYKRGKIPNLDAAGLVNIARSVGGSFGAVVAESSGECLLGQFGCVILQSARIVRAQVWCLTDGHVVVLVTHVCARTPDPAEVDEVQGIVHDLQVAETSQTAKTPWWMSWRRMRR